MNKQAGRPTSICLTALAFSLQSVLGSGTYRIIPSNNIRSTHRVLFLFRLFAGLWELDPENGTLWGGCCMPNLPNRSMGKLFRSPPPSYSSEVAEQPFEPALLESDPKPRLLYTPTPNDLISRQLLESSFGNAHASNTRYLACPS